MPEPATSLAAPGARINPILFLWLLVAIGAATMNPPGSVWATLLHLRVPDTDDAMRLAEVRDLANGQAWFDLTQHRFGSPPGIISHWSRLIDAPMAGLVAALKPLVGANLALGLTAVLWPLTLVIVYAVVLYRGVRASFGSRAAVLALLVATQTIGLTVQFAAGRVDHHDAQLTAILGLALAIIRGTSWAGAAGGALAALSLAIGLEGLPFVAVGALFLTFDWVLRGRPALPALLAFGAGLAVAAPVLFGVQTAPSRWSTTACDALSPPWLYLAEGGFGLTLACAGLDRLIHRPLARLAAVAGLGAILVAGFALLFPICLDGPFTGMTDLVREHWLLKVNEMTSAASFIAKGQIEALVFYAPLFAATLVATWFGLRAENRRPWLVAALFLWPGAILGLSEFRGIYVATGLVPLVAGAYIDRVLGLGTSRTRGAWAAGGAVVLGAAFLSTVWIGPVALADALLPNFRKATSPEQALSCLTDDALRTLSGLEPGTVLAPIFMGPAILLHTPHSIVGAPYHRAVPEIAATLEGFGGTETVLRRVTRTRAVRYLVACPARPADDLQAETAFTTRLARGEATARWLQPVPGPGPLKLWKVLP